MLFADADGASSFKSLATLQAALDSIEIPYPSAHSASAQASPIPGAEAESSAVETVAAEGLRHRNQKVNIQTVEPKAGVASEDKLERKLGIAIGSRAHLVSTDLVVKVRLFSPHRCSHRLRSKPHRATPPLRGERASGWPVSPTPSDIPLCAN